MRILILAIAMAICNCIVYAEGKEFVTLDSIPSTVDIVGRDNGIPTPNRVVLLKHPDRRVRQDSEEGVYKVIEMTKAGELGEKLGQDSLLVDSLVVKGPVNEADFTVMYRVSLRGRLEALNLSEAEIQGGMIPEGAFWRSEQFVFEDGWLIKIYVVQLRHVILPEGVIEIGEGAFGYNVCLEEINFPSTLTKIGKTAFTNCSHIRANQLVFPDGLETIGDEAFRECDMLDCDLELPATLKSIGFGAFHRSPITSVTFPEGLEKIGSYAFYLCNLQGEVVIPSSCATGLKAEGLFISNYGLESIVLPEGISEIPAAFADQCWSLRSINIPESVRTIGPETFRGCKALLEINLPEGLDSIKEGALHHCTSLGTIILPSTLTFLGGEALAFSGVKAIY